LGRKGLKKIGSEDVLLDNFAISFLLLCGSCQDKNEEVLRSVIFLLCKCGIKLHMERLLDGTAIHPLSILELVELFLLLQVELKI
jgi:hypothetical protein